MPHEWGTIFRKWFTLSKDLATACVGLGWFVAGHPLGVRGAHLG
ncbi:MAG: hypothetical protein ACLGQH_10920 [Acidobacteriota bacterium]